jgi:hypothetical protein
MPNGLIKADNFFRAAKLIAGAPAAFVALPLVGLVAYESFFLAAHRAFIAAEIRLRAKPRWRPRGRDDGLCH